MSLCFGLDASMALQAFEDAVGRSRKDELDVPLAATCAFWGWHLCDHVRIAVGPESSYAKENCLKTACPELGYLHYICNPVKHGDKSSPRRRRRKSRQHDPELPIRETRRQGGDFCPRDFDRRDFNTPRLVVDLPDGQTIEFMTIVDRVLQFWLDFFETHKIERLRAT